MLKITFFKKKFFTGFEAAGHANFDIEGKDIVCAAASALLQSAILGLSKTLKIKHKIKIKKGYLFFASLEGLDSLKTEKSQLLLKTLFESLKQLAKQHPKYIKINIAANRLRKKYT